MATRNGGSKASKGAALSSECAASLCNSLIFFEILNGYYYIIFSKGNTHFDKIYNLLDKLSSLRSDCVYLNDLQVSEESILKDASRYIQELKDKFVKLIEDLESSHQDTLPLVKVKTLKKGFKVKVFSENSNPDLLVYLLEAFDELGLDVVDARVSTTNNFLLEAMVANEGGSGGINVKAVEKATAQAIRKWKQQQD